MQGVIARTAAADERFARNAVGPEREPDAWWADTYDPDWWRPRIAATGRRWSLDEDRANATLWWYSASHSYCGIFLTPLWWCGQALAVGADSPVWFAANGYLQSCAPTALVAREDLIQQLHDIVAPSLVAASQASGAAVASLWALTADALSAVALMAGRTRGLPDQGSQTARDHGVAGAGTADPATAVGGRDERRRRARVA